MPLLGSFVTCTHHTHSLFSADCAVVPGFHSFASGIVRGVGGEDYGSNIGTLLCIFLCNGKIDSLG
jgi:hypothetical protein